MTELVGSGGYGNVTMRKLARLAGVSTATLYARYDGKDDCVTSAHGAVMDRVAQRLASVEPSSPGSDRQLAQAIRGALAVFEEDPAAARLALVEVFDAGTTALHAVGKSEERLAGSLRDVLEGQRGGTVSAVTARWITAGILAVARSSAIAGRRSPSGEETSELLRWADRILAADPRDLIPPPGSGAPPVPPRSESERSAAVPARSERDLILSAVARIGAEQGYSRLSAAEIRRAAGFTRASIARHFADLDECYLASVELLSERYLGSLLRGPTGGNWATTVRRRTAGLFTDVLSNRPTARFVFAGVLAPGVKGLLRRELIVTEFARRLRAVAPADAGSRWRAPELDLAALWSTLADDIALGAALEGSRRRDFGQI